jgi:hypothetical protein
MSGDAMTLGEIVDQLSAIPGETPVQFEHEFRWFGYGPNIVGLDSWRGVYAHLALGHDHPDLPFTPSGQRAETVADLLALLTDAIGQTFVGYKGGDYTGDRNQHVFVDNYGESGGPGVVGVVVRDGTALLLTGGCELPFGGWGLSW